MRNLRKEHEEDLALGDGEYRDESDPEFLLEIFAAFHALGWKPQDLGDREVAGKYADWLNALPDSE